jgi:hypothetical protein
LNPNAAAIPLSGKLVADAGDNLDRYRQQVMTMFSAVLSRSIASWMVNLNVQDSRYPGDEAQALSSALNPQTPALAIARATRPD